MFRLLRRPCQAHNEYMYRVPKLTYPLHYLGTYTTHERARNTESQSQQVAATQASLRAGPAQEHSQNHLGSVSTSYLDSGPKRLVIFGRDPHPTWASSHSPPSSNQGRFDAKDPGGAHNSGEG